MVRESIECQQKLLLPLLAMIGFVSKTVEVSNNEPLLPIIKSTAIFGTISLLYKCVMYKTTSLGENKLRFPSYVYCWIIFLPKPRDVLIGCINEKLTFKLFDVDIIS